MTTKKTIKKPIAVKSTEEYNPVFPTIEVITTKKIDLNWVSIRRKIQAINFFKISLNNKLNSDFNLKSNLPSNFNLKTYNPGEQELKDFHARDEKLNLWEMYCNWFNESFNKEELKDDEDYNKIEQAIRGKKYE